MKALLVLWVALALTMSTLQADGEELISGNLERRLIDRNSNADATVTTKDGAATTTTITRSTLASLTAGGATTITSELSSSADGQNPSQGTFGEETKPETDPGTTHVFTDVSPTPKPKVPRRE